MKKFQILLLGAISAFAVSCNGGGSISSNVTLNSGVDTLAYAYGVNLGSQGLEQYLNQLGVVKDTMQFRYEFMSRIQAETDSLKKIALNKELSGKIDSLKKANAKNLNDFLAGLKDGIKVSEDKASYQRGVEIGGQLKMMSEGMAKQVYGQDTKEKLNVDAMLAGLVAALKKEKPAVENAQMVFESKMKEIQEKAAAEQEEKLKAEYTPNIEAGEKFLAENKAKDGVVTLPDGLQYKVIKEGIGPKPTASDRVKVHYHGTLIDGTVFDSSVDRGEPATFGVGQVIKGWTEALQLMPAGSKWMLYVPYDLAYGGRETGAIKPFSTLIFEVELLEVLK